MNIYPSPLSYAEEHYIKEEKKSIRKAANITALAFFMLSSIMIFWNVPVETLVYLLSDDPRVIIKYLATDETVRQVIQITVSTLAFTLPFIIYSFFMKVKLKNVGSFNKATNKKLVLPLILVGIGVCGLSNALIGGAGSFFEFLGFSYNTVSYNYPTNPYGVMLSVLSTAVTPALVEEFAMRGAVMGALRKYGDGFAVITSAVLFGLMHGNLVQIPFAFVLGLFFGYAVIKTGTIWTAVIIHFLNNLFSVCLDYIYMVIPNQYIWLGSLIYLVILMGIGFVGFALLHSVGGTDFVLNKPKGILSTPKKLKVFFTAPCIIIVYLIVLVESFFIYAV